MPIPTPVVKPEDLERQLTIFGDFDLSQGNPFEWKNDLHGCSGISGVLPQKSKHNHEVKLQLHYSHRTFTGIKLIFSKSVNSPVFGRPDKSKDSVILNFSALTGFHTDVTTR